MAGLAMQPGACCGCEEYQTCGSCTTLPDGPVTLSYVPTGTDCAIAGCTVASPGSVSLPKIGPVSWGYETAAIPGPVVPICNGCFNDTGYPFARLICNGSSGLLDLQMIFQANPTSGPVLDSFTVPGTSATAYSCSPLLIVYPVPGGFSGFWSSLTISP